MTNSPSEKIKQMAPEIDVRVGKNLRAVRLQLGLDEFECAALLRLDVAQYLASEAGLRRLQAGELFTLAERLRVSLSRFYRIDSAVAGAAGSGPARGSRSKV